MLSQRKIKNQSNPNNPNHMNKEPEPIETFFPTKKKTAYKKKGVQGWRGNKTETVKESK